jgi:hypothetical protein
METVNEILDALAKALDYAPFLAAIGTFSLCGQIAKQIFSKKKAVQKGKYQWFFWWMCKLLPLHPVAAGIALGWYDSAHGVAYYVFAAVISVFIYDLIERLTGFDIQLPGESLPPDA